MAINYPTSLDDFSNPESSDTFDSPSHPLQHSNKNDAIEALEAKVGVDDSAVTSSHDYLVRAKQVFVTVGRSVADYVCDGTDDNVQIQAAIDAVSAAGGGVVFIKAGTYSISSTIVWTGSNVEINGERTAILSAAGGLTYILKPNGDFSTVRNIKLLNGHIHVVGTDGSEGLRIENIEIENGYIQTETGRSNSIYKGNYIHGNVIGINIYANGQKYENVVIEGNIIEDTEDDGIAVVGHGYQGYNISVIGNAIKNCGTVTGGGIKVDKGSSYIDGVTTALENVVVQGNSIYSDVSTFCGIQVTDLPSYISVIGNVLRGSFNFGIWADLQFGKIANNLISLKVAAKAIRIGYTDYGLIISNNFMRCDTNAGSYGIYLQYRCRFILMEGNYFNYLQYGLYEDGGATLFRDNIFVDNLLRLVTTPLTLVDTLTVAKNNTGLNLDQEVEMVRMKNTSGGNLVAGNVVVLKAVAAGNEFTTTTVQGDDLVLGMLPIDIANNAWGYIQILGKTTLLKVNGTTDIAIGDFIGTFTTAGIGMKATSGDMAFAIALEAYTTDDSNGVIDALLIKPRKI